MGVDMLSELSEEYLVAGVATNGAGDSMFRPSSILPRLIDSDEVQTAHPYNFEDDDEVMAQRVAKVEQEEKMDLEKMQLLL